MQFLRIMYFLNYSTELLDRGSIQRGPYVQVLCPVYRTFFGQTQVLGPETGFKLITLKNSQVRWKTVKMAKNPK